MVAQTESLRLVHVGQDEVWRQAIEAEIVDPERIVREWRSLRDLKVRPTHTVLDGQQRRWDEPFESPSGALIRFPGDPLAPLSEVINCRCFLLIYLLAVSETGDVAA